MARGRTPTVHPKLVILDSQDHLDPLWIFVDLSLHVNSDYDARSFGDAS
jgi:hypothetical protein